MESGSHTFRMSPFGTSNAWHLVGEGERVQVSRILRANSVEPIFHLKPGQFLILSLMDFFLIYKDVQRGRNKSSLPGNSRQHLTILRVPPRTSTNWFTVSVRVILYASSGRVLDATPLKRCALPAPYSRFSILKGP